MPQYAVGHESRMEKLKQSLTEEYPQIKLVGSSYDGISIPDCISQGKKAALEMIESIFEKQFI
ncbi:hypothetical protein D7X33_24725 [Butyricicoccus sp. 1XD8-22]|nr:hypothetical protein D7X33_24725 [Butyricicoccus sp. 1XD8-22]